MRSNAGIDALRVAVGSRGYAYMELSTLGGEWINMGAVAVGSRDVDFFNAATLRRTIDDNTWSLSAQFAREVGVGSLSPFRTDSVVNVEDGSYAPLADLHRRWRLWVAAPTPLTFRELARGWTDKITISGDQAVITIEGRGEEADLIDRRIIFVDPSADPPVPITSDTPKSYASGALEDVLQAILDDHLGPGVVTLTVDSSAPAFFVNGWDQTTDVGLFDLLTQVAGLAGASVAYRYDDDDVLSLTLFTPNRAPTTPDWTTNARAYERLDASIDKQPIRNYVVVKYVDDTFGVQVVTSPTTPASASITRYGLRPLVIDLASSTQITDQASAGNLADAICADLEFPSIEQDLTEVNAWFGELWDYVRTDANGVHYNEDQFGGVTSVSHVFQNGMLRSSFGLRGKPSGGYRRWLNFGTGTPRTPFTPVVTNLTASFKEQLDVLGGGTLLPGVFTAATVNQYARSVTFELSDALDFSTVIATTSVDVVDGTAETGWVGSGYITAGTDYYVRATPFSGALDGGDPTGVAGEFVVANTRTLPKPTDTATLEWDTSDPSMLKANVVGLDSIGEGTEDIATAVEIGTPIVFYLSPLASAQWLALTAIPAAASEIGSEFRRQEHAAGAGRIRLHAHVKAKTGTPTLAVKSSTDDFGTTPTDCVSLSVTGTGRIKSDWATLDTASRADVQFSAYALDGADTGAVDLYALWAELLPDLVTAFRDFSDDFSDDFS